MSQVQSVAREVKQQVPEALWSWLMSYTRRRAWRAGLSYGLNSAQTDDLQQELLADVARRWRYYDSDRSPQKAYVAMLVTKRLNQFANNKIRTVRNHKDTTESLDEPLPVREVGARTKADLVPDNVHDKRLKQPKRRPLFEQINMELDVRELVNDLPPDLQQLCNCVMEKHVRGAAEELKMPESTVRSKLRRLQKHFDPVKSYVRRGDRRNRK